MYVWCVLQTAAAAGIDVQCRSISAEELGQFLAIEGHVAIVLLDKGILTGSKPAVHMQGCECEQCETSYAGAAPLHIIPTPRLAGLFGIPLHFHARI